MQINPMPSTFEYLKDTYRKATLTPKEFANECGRSETHIRRMCEDGRIKAARIGCRWAIPLAECAAILDGESR